MCESVLWRWRKALGVSRINNEGSQRLIHAASEPGAEQLRGWPLTPEQVERRRRTAHELNLGRFLREAYHESQWTKAEVRLLGKVPDAEVARRTGRTIVPSFYNPNHCRQGRQTLAQLSPFLLRQRARRKIIRSSTSAAASTAEAGKPGVSPSGHQGSIGGIFVHPASAPGPKRAIVSGIPNPRDQEQPRRETGLGLFFQDRLSHEGREFLKLSHTKRPCARRSRNQRIRHLGPWRASLQWGLVWLIGTQVALVAFLEWRRPEFFDPKYGCRMEALRARRQFEPRRTLLATLGSSRVEQGFRPAVLEASTDEDSPLFYNLARGGSSPLMHLLTLRRLLADGVRPDVLLVEIFPPVLVEENGDVTVFKPTLRDWPVLRRYPLSAETYAFWLRDRALFWHKYRNGLLAWLAPNWLSPRARWGDRLWDYRGGEWRVIGDGVAPAERQRLTADARRRYIHALEHFQITDAADRALRELLELCGQQRIAVVLFLMPESSEFRSWYGPEARHRLRDYLAELQGDFGVALLDARTWIGDDDFSDGHHLLQHGAAVFTRRFIAEILSLREQEQRRQGEGVK